MSQPIDSFAELAASYCTLIERHGDYTAQEFIARVREVLPQLYYYALRLPDMETTDQELDHNINHDEWSATCCSLRRKFGINDHYWEIYEPLKLEHDDPVAGSLSDDLADIWRDLRPGVTRWSDSSDTMQKQIIWEWRFSFHQHWSNHAVDALRVINWITKCYGVRDAQNDA